MRCLPLVRTLAVAKGCHLFSTSKSTVLALPLPLQEGALLSRGGIASSVVALIALIPCAFVLSLGLALSFGLIPPAPLRSAHSWLACLF
jgi:hypothetical protein